jgi:alkanesulfonate monooxygenase SsuD/methylene tetrahydromethanopterin reductase-like flavin-dependent oxidoreductase (luciferase family)
MSPLLCLTYAASVTSRIRLATGVLVLPYYHPLTLARQIQTLYSFSQGRFVLGVGTGWDRYEFESLGLRLSERGARTDEILAALRRLLTESDVTFEGRFYRFAHATITPQPLRLPELWVAGGSKLESRSSADKPYMATSVLERIAAADGWLSRGDASPEMLIQDLHVIRAHLERKGRNPDTLRLGHYNCLHLVDTDDPGEAVRLQQEPFERVMGTQRSLEDLQRCYLFGTTTEILQRIADLERAGFQYFILMTLDDHLDQLERFAADIMPSFGSRG